MTGIDDLRGTLLTLDHQAKITGGAQLCLAASKQQQWKN
jgi:hypothetical protein